MKQPEDFSSEKLEEKAREALEETLETDYGTPLEEKIEKVKKTEKKVEEESRSEIPFTWDPREIQYLTNNRNSMDNEELKEFLEKESDLQKEIRDTDWEKFSKTEERFIV